MRRSMRGSRRACCARSCAGRPRAGPRIGSLPSSP